MRALICLAFLATFTLAVLAEVNLPIESKKLWGICANVGIYSGCSGCEHGTGGLCKFVSFDPLSDTANVGMNIVLGAASLNLPGLKRGIEPPSPMLGNLQYCVPSSVAVAVNTALPDVYHLLEDICPADPSKEPILSQELMVSLNLFCQYGIVANPAGLSVDYSDGGTAQGCPGDFALFNQGCYAKMPKQEVSMIRSKAHTSDLAAFPHEPWYVDRTSMWGDAGYGVLALGGRRPASKAYSTPYFPTCTELTSADLIDLDTILFGLVATQKDLECALIYLGAFISTRCPEYGRAVSGICESLYTSIATQCGQGLVTVQHLNTTTSTFNINLIMMSPVPDDTPYCLSKVPTMPSGQLKALLLEKAGTIGTLLPPINDEYILPHFFSKVIPSAPKAYNPLVLEQVRMVYLGVLLNRKLASTEQLKYIADFLD